MDLSLSRWTRPLYLFAVVTLVTMISGAAVFWLHDYSSSQYRAAVEADELGLLAFHLNTSAWRYVLDSQPDPQVPVSLTEDGELEAAVLLQSAIDRYNTEASEGNSIATRGDIETMAGYVLQARQLVLDGHPEEAVGVMFSGQSVYYAMADEVYVESQEHAASAVRSERLAGYATVGVYILTFLAVATVYWASRSAQRRIDHATAEQEILRRSEARFRPLVQSSSDVIAVIDGQARVTYVSPAIQNLTGLDPEEAQGRSVLDFLVADERHSFELFIADVRVRSGLTASTEIHLVPARFSEEPRDVQVVCTNRLHDPDVNGLVLNIRDISERKALEDQLRHQAFFDSLTELANRLRFMDRLDYALVRGRRSGKETISVIYMDLDHFKYINDERGHSTGDALLKQVGQRLLGCIRPSDTAARLGGDEFAVLLEDPRSAGEATKVADRILGEMAKPFQVDDHELHITASMGLVTADATMTAEEVIRNADLAMYDAKENGRARVHVFESGMQVSLVERLQLINDMGEAMDKDQFVIHYQPTFNLQTQRITGFEALVRWNHPERGLLEPDDFISLAEESGAIHQLGALVLEKACVQAREWQDTLPATAGMNMGVNLSAKQLVREGFVESVKEILDRSGFDPHRLILEVTESVLVPQPLQALAALEKLKRLGIQVALDDFGTGYSSLSYLKRFPLDIIKIDRSFIEGIDNTDRDRILVQTVIDLGLTLNLEVVAEGIERPEQVERLKTLHCDVGQGYLFARPMESRAVEELLRTTDGALPQVAPQADNAA